LVAHCLFEQSGTFKNEFKKLGYEAYDYDIQNEFGETDFVIDLFAEIEGGYQGKPSVFDNISTDDLILAFFPCTRFESRVPLWFRGEAQQQKNWTIFQKLDYSMNLHDELHEFYLLISKLVYVAKKKGLRMVIENPYMQPHYLTTYWCLRPTLIDKDRTQNGDYYQKPTQYWFINCEPYYNLVFEPLDYVERQVIAKVKKKDGLSVKTQRSMIHPQYANRFIRQYLIEQE
jgi:hypothetical protein